MKRLLALALFLPALLFGQAQTITPNIGLQIPGYNSANWQVPLDFNFNALDKFISVKVALLAPPSSVPGQFLWVGDGISTIDCTVGGGNIAVACKSNGSAWVPIGSGSGGGGGGGGFPSCGLDQIPYYASAGTTVTCLTIGTGLSITGGIMTATGAGGGITQLTGDVTAGPGSGSVVATAVRINGTTIPVSTAADMFLGTTAPGVAQWAVMPNCPDTGGNHLNYVTATHLLSCGTTGSGGFTYTAPGTGAVAVSGTSQFTAATLHGIDYGMICDGSTDNAAALQNAVNALSIAASVGPARLQLPAGVCVMKSPLITSASNLEIFGAGTTIRAFGTSEATGAALPEIMSFTGSNIYLHDFGLDGNMANLGLGLNVTAYSASTTYYPSGAVNPNRADGGGNDTVAVVSGSTVTIYNCILTTTGNAPPNATYWHVLDTFTNTAQAAYITGGTGSGMLIRFTNNGRKIRMNNMDLQGGQFGIYMFATAASINDIELTNSTCHDFNVQQDEGNNAVMDCLHSYVTGGNTISNVRIANNLFQNIYVAGTGPGNTSAGFFTAYDVTITGNEFNQVLNRGGGTGIVAATAISSQWTTTGNVYRKTASLNNDKSDGIEVENQNSTYSNNSIFGYFQCMSQTNIPPANVGVNTFTGNTCQGNGTGNGIVITESGGAGNGQTIDTAITGNTFYGFLYGIWLGISQTGTAPAVNVVQSGNVCQSCTSGLLYDPNNSTGWIWINYTPSVTITGSGGGYTPLTTPSAYIQNGKSVTIQSTPTGTISGTYTAASMTVTLPVVASYQQYLPVSIAAPGCTGVSVPQAFISGGSSNLLIDFNATCSGAQTVYIFIAGTYQTQ
jgi:hypothetical protein